ncbi:MAG: phosphotransferase [Oscillospiraceae bacterium]|jgi:thiamine kinase-like enzyme|nr:phosphotransferase [Oscillospiraceae bacterium]
MNSIGKMIGQGNTAEIYEYGEDCVLKLYRSAMPEQLCHDEFRFTMIAYQATQKVPQPIEIIRAAGRIGAVYKRISGKTMLIQMLKKPWKLKYYATLLAEYHNCIHTPVIDAEIPDVKDKLRLDIQSSDDLSEDEKQQIYSNLLSLPDGNALCHFDFHPDNVLVFENQYCVLDWMTACKGDELSDVARTGIILKFGKMPRVPDIVNLVVGTFQKSVYKKYIRRYIEITGANIECIEKWELAIAAARLREWIPAKEKQVLLKFIRQRLKLISFIA